MVPSFVLRTERVARRLAAEPVATATVARTATAASRARRRDRALIGGPPGLGCVSSGRTPARRADPLASRWERVWAGRPPRRTTKGAPTRPPLATALPRVGASYFSST